MLKADELRLPGSCLNRAAIDEPIFVLLGRDAQAPITIYDWCVHRIEAGKNRANDLQIREAINIAAKMNAYFDEILEVRNRK